MNKFKERTISFKVITYSLAKCVELENFLMTLLQCQITVNLRKRTHIDSFNLFANRYGTDFFNIGNVSSKHLNMSYPARWFSSLLIENDWKNNCKAGSAATVSV